MSETHDIDRQVRVYMVVFVALAALTVITVAVSYLDLSTGLAIAAALLIASVKGSLVVCYFMHLISEKSLIYWVMGFTVLFFLACLIGPALTQADAVEVP